MITCLRMDETCLLTSCLHSGPIPLAQCRDPESTPAYIETAARIPQGTVSRMLRGLCERYGACGIIALCDELVVGKIRFCPKAVSNAVPFCVQQEEPVRGLVALDLQSLPTREESPVLAIQCFQVAEGYRGRGIAGAMLDALIEWAKAEGWTRIVADAGRQIAPLLNWSGQPGCDSLRRRGFVVTSEYMSPELREGVVSQRGGYHGPEVKRQWEPFADLSDDEAAVVYRMGLEIE